MPVYLAPLTRRQFLKRSVAFGTGLALAPGVLASQKSTDEHSWALLSDIHLAADRKRVERGVNMTDHFTNVSRDLLALPRTPAGVIICGDCAFNSGQSADYSVVADLLQPVRAGRMPVHLMLGNHDNRQRFWDAFPAEKAHARPLLDRQVALVRTPRANWFLMDSLEKTQSTPGLLGKEQLDWLKATLDANPDKPALVFVHHNPGIDGGNMGLKDTLLLLDILRPRNQVKAYIFGHTHHWEVTQDYSGIHLVNLPAVAYVFRDGEPSGWVHAALLRHGLRLRLHCIDPHHKDNGQVVKLAWRA